MAAKQDNRVDELEKQHQSDRARIHELKENIDSAERSIMDGKTTLELEQAQRKRVEARLKAAEQSNSTGHTPTVRAGGASLTPNQGAFAGPGETPSSIEVRTKMLYGDVDDMDGKEQEGGYDDDMLSRYQLDSESALSVIGASPHNSPNKDEPLQVCRDLVTQYYYILLDYHMMLIS